MKKFLFNIWLSILVFIGACYGGLIIERLQGIIKPNMWQTIHDGVEFLYFFSGVILTIFAYKALKQIEIAKKDIHTKSKREALTMTAVECEKYANEIMPLYSSLMQIARDRNLLYRGSFLKFEINEDTTKWINENQPKLNEVVAGCPIANRIFDFFNKLEALSIYFVNGVCDEKVAYRPLSGTFLSSVEGFYPLLSYSYQINGFYKNVIELYGVWSSRKKQEKASAKVDEYYYKLTKAQASVAATACRTITPVGVDEKEK